MRHPQRLILALPLAILLAGCGRDGDPLAPDTQTGTGAEQQAVSDELSRHPEMVDDGVNDSEETTAIDGSAGAGTSLNAEIRPLFFWRRITDVDRRFEFAFADTDSTGRPTTAVVTIHKHLSGTFNIVVKDSTAEGEPTEGQVIRKRLNDHWVRRVLLKRIVVDGARGDRTAWRIVASSGVKITARDSETRIQSLRVQTASFDTTLTDPLEFQRLRRIPRLEAGEDVRLTVTTLAADDVVILYARGGRHRFHPNGDNTYSGVWKAPLLRGLYHAGVNALSHGTLYDDEAPYDSQSWILPYLVKPEDLGDYMP